MTREIPLTQGYVTLVDDVDYDRLAPFKWQVQISSNTAYAKRSVRRNGRKVSVFMHREICGAAVGQEIDHIDRDGLNNQRSNLRIATRQINTVNQRMRRNNTSGYRGVFRRRDCNRWLASIQVNGRQIHLGNHVSKVDAARAYDRAALHHFGEFAQLNFPDERNEVSS